MFTAERKMLEAQGRLASGPVGEAVSSPALLQEIKALLGPIADRLDSMDQRISELSVGIPVAIEKPTDVEAEPIEESDLDELRLLKTEIRALQHCIEETKNEVAALHQSDEKQDRLNLLKDELDAIVSDTETATGNILDRMEKIDEHTHQILSSGERDEMTRQLLESISEEVTQVFEICNFQDLTGQRITKVVNTLKYVEERVTKIIGIWGEDAFKDVEISPEEQALYGQDGLERMINQSRENTERVSQSDIDSMFD